MVNVFQLGFSVGKTDWSNLEQMLDFPQLFVGGKRVLKHLHFARFGVFAEQLADLVPSY